MTAYLYRLHTPAGELALVGVTTRTIADRLRDHRNRSYWWPEIDPDLTEATAYETLDEAKDARDVALRTERPRFNVHHAARVTYVGGLSTEPPTPMTPAAPPSRLPRDTPAIRVGRRQSVKARVDALKPPPDRLPGGFIPGDRVTYVPDGRPAVVGHASELQDDFQVLFADGHTMDVMRDQLTMVTPVENR